MLANALLNAVVYVVLLYVCLFCLAILHCYYLFIFGLLTQFVNFSNHFASCSVLFYQLVYLILCAFVFDYKRAMFYLEKRHLNLTIIIISNYYCCYYYYDNVGYPQRGCIPQTQPFVSLGLLVQLQSRTTFGAARVVTCLLLDFV